MPESKSPEQRLREERQRRAISRQYSANLATWDRDNQDRIDRGPVAPEVAPQVQPDHVAND